MDPPPRIATLVMVTGEGELLGSLPPFPVETPWWMDARPVVREAHRLHSVDSTVLRLLAAERPTAHGGAVTYLAESAVGGSIPSRPWGGMLDEHPLRQSWARPGGPAGDLAWADAALDARDTPRTGEAQQIRTWNLCSLWRLPTNQGAAWLKVVPSFFAHEGKIIELLAGEAVPQLLAHDGPRLLMAEGPGEDLHTASRPRLLEMVTGLIDLQRGWLGRADELLPLGLPDWRVERLTEAIASTIERTGPELGAPTRATLGRLVRGLPDRFARIAAADIPDSLVHGDFHPGNHRGDAHGFVLLDWGDSGIGHPLLDQPAFLDRVPAVDRDAIIARWDDAWKAAVPGSDPVRARILLAPVAAARQAVIYRRFLDNIEPSEHPYHAADPAAWLRRAAAIIDAEPQ